MAFHHWCVEISFAVNLYLSHESREIVVCLRELIFQMSSDSLSAPAYFAREHFVVRVTYTRTRLAMVSPAWIL